MKEKHDVEFIGDAYQVNPHETQSLSVSIDNVPIERINGKYEESGKELGKLVDEKQKAYGDSITKTNKLLRIFLEDYSNGDGTYTIPDSLLNHIGLMVRMIDKQNRIFSNPSGDLMSEKPYNDLAGYSLLGNELKND